MSGILGASCSVATLVVSSFVSGFFRSSCICECPSEKDSPVLQVLQSQLDRCGPEHLNGTPCRELTWQARAFEWVFCFTIGVLLSQLCGHWVRTWQVSRAAVAQASRRELWTEAFSQQLEEPSGHIEILEDASTSAPRWHPGPRSSARRISGR